MKKIASELLIERLIDWGVDTVFGLPGDGMLRGLKGLPDAIRVTWPDATVTTSAWCGSASPAGS